MIPSCHDVLCDYSEMNIQTQLWLCSSMTPSFGVTLSDKGMRFVHELVKQRCCNLFVDTTKFWSQGQWDLVDFRWWSNGGAPIGCCDFVSTSSGKNTSIGFGFWSCSKGATATAHFHGHAVRQTSARKSHLHIKKQTWSTTIPGLGPWLAWFTAAHQRGQAHANHTIIVQKGWSEPLFTNSGRTLFLGDPFPLLPAHFISRA